jgi:hypothetical protein
MLICKHCSKESKSLKSLVNHERLCASNPGKQTSSLVAYNKSRNNEPWNKGKVGVQEAWNKGLPGTFLGKKHTAESKQKISEKLSINNKGGRAKWYMVAGQNVQGTWERDIATKFEQLNIRWIKLKTNKDMLKYEMNGKIRSYTPDFYLPDYDMYVEVKGFWWGDDKEKMKIVLQTYSDKTIAVVEKEEYQEIMLL